MPTSLSPEERSQRARIAAHTRWSREDGVAGTKAARDAGPGSIDYWIARVEDADGLPEREVRRRAESLKKAHYARLAFASAKARRRKANGGGR